MAINTLVKSLSKLLLTANFCIICIWFCVNANFNKHKNVFDWIDLGVLPPNLDDLTPSEELDENIIEDFNYNPKGISRTI